MPSIVVGAQLGERADRAEGDRHHAGGLGQAERRDQRRRLSTISGIARIRLNTWRHDEREPARHEVLGGDERRAAARRRRRTACPATPSRSSPTSRAATWSTSSHVTSSIISCRIHHVARGVEQALHLASRPDDRDHTTANSDDDARHQTTSSRRERRARPGRSPAHRVSRPGATAMRAGARRTSEPSRADGSLARSLAHTSRRRRNVDRRSTMNTMMMNSTMIALHRSQSKFVALKSLRRSRCRRRRRARSRPTPRMLSSKRRARSASTPGGSAARPRVRSICALPGPGCASAASIGPMSMPSSVSDVSLVTTAIEKKNRARKPGAACRCRPPPRTRAAQHDVGDRTG